MKDRGIISILFLLTFLYSADNQVIAPLLPSIREAFDTPVEWSGFWGGAYNLAAAISALVMGPWSDRLGRKRFLWIGALLFGGASFLCAFSWDFTSMLVSRFLVGFAGGMISMSAQALVGDYFPRERRGSAMGMVLAGRFLGLSLGVVIGILFAQWLGWQANFLFFTVFGVCCAWPAWKRLPQITPEGRVSAHPLETYRRLLVNRSCFFAVVVSMLNSAGLGGFLFFIGFWLIEAFGFALWQIMLVFVLTGIISFGGSMVSGRYADRYGRKRMVLLGNVLSALSFAAIPLFAGHLIMACILFGVLGLAVAFWMAPLHTLITELVPAHERGSLVALKNASALLGIAVVQSVNGYLYADSGYLAVGLLSAVLAAIGYALLHWQVTETLPATG